MPIFILLSVLILPLSQEQADQVSVFLYRLAAMWDDIQVWFADA
jgi:hypothetical protein